MPLYQYNCVDHGPFEAFRSMSVADLPAPCPTCQRMSPRQFLPVAVISDTSLFTSDRLGDAAGLNNDKTVVGRHYRKLADQAGVVTHGRQYMQQLARFPGDPRAWVASRGEMLAIAKERNLNVEGIINHKAIPSGPLELGIAEDIAKAKAKKIMAEKPGISMEAALEIAVDRHAPPGHKRIIKKKPKSIPRAPKLNLRKR